MRRIALSLIGVLVLGVSLAHATETQWWNHRTAADYAKAETRGVVVHADGTLENGPDATSFADDSLRTAWAVAVLADGSVAVAGDHGRIDRWTAQGGLKPWVRLGAGQVLCLMRDGNDLIAGMGPRGLIYRISAKGDTSLVVRTGERYVWGLASAGRGALWAATGTRGKLLRVESGKATVVFDSDESNLVSMTSDGRDGVFTGGDSQGRVYHTRPDGRTTTEFDASEDEIRALVRGADGALWAAGLSASAQNDDATDEDDRPGPARNVIAGGRAVLYRIVPDSATVAWWTSPQPLVFALASGPQGLLAATGNRAAIFQVEGPNAASQWLSPAQGQVTALATAGDGTVWAATANPVVLWRIGPGRSREGVLTAAALDARRFARFGRARWHGAGHPLLETRSGNSDAPDTTWSAWSALGAGADGAPVASPAARYLQWRAKLGAGDRIDEVDFAYREQNLPPRVEDIGVAPQGQGFREGELGLRSESVTQTLGTGQKVEYSVTMPSNKPIRELPIWARSLRSLQWRGVDANGDALRYRIEVRREDGGAWVEIGKDLEATLYTWNTNSLPDGRYRVRVTASDKVANAVGEERTGSSVSEPFDVDNTPPQVATLGSRGARVEGTAIDASSPITRLEVAVDDGDWRTVAPDDGLADSREAHFGVTLPDLAPGEHLVSIRAIDLAGNAATRAISIQVPAAAKPR